MKCCLIHCIHSEENKHGYYAEKPDFMPAKKENYVTFSIRGRGTELVLSLLFFFINFIALLGLIFILWIVGFFGIWKHEIKDISEDAGDIFAQAYPVVK